MEKQSLEFLNISLQFIIPILQFLLLIIPFLGKAVLYNASYSKNFLKGISFRGYVFLVVALITIICSVGQSLASDELSNIKDYEFNKRNEYRDSINQSKNEAESFKTKEMLAAYGYKVDSANNVLVKNIGKTTIINGETPYFHLCGLKVDTIVGINLLFHFTYCTSGSTSYKINAKVDVIGYDDDYRSMYNPKGFVFLSKNSQLINSSTISVDQQSTNPFVVRYYKFFQFYFFRIHGTYEDSNKHILDIEETYYVSYPANAFGHAAPATAKQDLERIIEINNPK